MAAEWPETFTIKARRDDGPSWEQYNPTLKQGEPGFEIDTGLLKFGDGITPWNELPYTTTSFYSATSSHRLDLDGRIPGARRHTMAGNTTVTLEAPPAGHAVRIDIVLEQDDDGERTVTWPGDIRWIDGAAPVAKTGEGAITVVELQWIGEWIGRTVGTAD